jgi:hypothetical protein
MRFSPQEGFVSFDSGPRTESHSMDARRLSPPEGASFYSPRTFRVPRAKAESISLIGGEGSPCKSYFRETSRNQSEKVTLTNVPPQTMVSVMDLSLPAQIAGILSFILAYVARKKTNKKWLPWVLGFVAVLCFAFGWKSGNQRNTGQNAATQGNNSPVQNVSAVLSGTGTINQTVNIGPTKEDLKEILVQRAITANRELTSRYTNGFGLLGVADGKIVYEPRTRNFSITADWDHATLEIIKGNFARLYLPGFGFQSAHGNAGSNNTLRIECRFKEGAPSGPFDFAPWDPSLPRIYLEVLDKKEKIFVLGFRDAE